MGQRKESKKNFFSYSLTFLLSYSLTLCLYTCLYASDEIYATSVVKSPIENGSAVKKMATIVLNDCIKVKEIQIIKVDGRVSLKYPTYISKNSREYPQFEPLTKQAKDEIEKVVETGKPSAKESKSMSYKISKFSRFNSESALKVFCAIDFNNAVRLECKVMENGKGAWISWPSRKPDGEGKWVKQVIIINKKLKDSVEKELLDKYKTFVSESSEEE
ncbi:MAG: septation protein SpoVG family protein [Elusimicrobiota bacterium]